MSLNILTDRKDQGVVENLRLWKGKKSGIVQGAKATRQRPTMTVENVFIIVP